MNLTALSGNNGHSKTHENGHSNGHHHRRNGLLRGLFKHKNGNGHRDLSRESLRESIEELIEDHDEEHDGNGTDSHESTLIANILELRNMTAADVMIPRADITAIDMDRSREDLIQTMTESAHSRVPVYRETLDDVVGFIHIKDVLKSLAQPDASFSISRIMRKVLMVAPSIRTLDLLLEMRSTRTQMAIVVDEYGGVDGLITIEDLIEGIVGEIHDEHDSTAPPVLTRRQDGVVVADARASIEELEALMGVEIEAEDRDDIDTLGGFVFAHSGRIPARGELIRLDNGLEFEIAEADSRRIKRLRVRLRTPRQSRIPSPAE